MNFIELLQISEQEVKILLQHYRCVYCFFIVLSVYFN